MPTLVDVRQSKNWSDYLNAYKWESIPSNLGFIRVNRFPFGAVAKLQKPINNATSGDLKELDHICKSNNCFFVKVEGTFAHENDLYSSFGYKNSSVLNIPAKTLLIDLNKNEKDLWEDLSSSAKYSVNRARREKVSIDLIKDPSNEQLKACYFLLKDTGSKKGFYVQTFSDLCRKAEVFKGNFYLTNSFDSKGALTCSKVYLANNKNIFYIHGGISDSGQRQKDGYLLMWETFMYFKNLGFNYLDLDGLADERFPKTSLKWKGFSDFKKKFGGTELTFAEPKVKYYNPAFRLLSLVGASFRFVDFGNLNMEYYN